MSSDEPAGAGAHEEVDEENGAALIGGGDLGTQIRSFRWDATPLGTFAQWPLPLRSAVQMVLDNPFPAAVAWGEGLTCLFNDAYALSFGVTPEALGNSFRDVWPEPDEVLDPLLAQAFEGAATRLDTAKLEFTRGGSETPAWFDYSLIPLRDETGVPAGVLCQALEVTQRVLAERARLQSELRLKEAVNAAGLSSDFRALFEAAPTPLVVLQPPDWTIVAANNARLEATGTTREGTIGRKLFDAFPDDPNDPEADGVRNLSASLRRVLDTGAADVMALQRYAIKDAHGQFEERWWSPVNTPVLGQDGEVALVIHRVEDVTGLVKMRGERAASDQLARDQQGVIDRLRLSEAAQRTSEARYRQIVEGAEDFAIVSIDAAGVVTGWNSGAVRITGFSKDEAIGSSADIIFTPGDRKGGVPEREMIRAETDGKAPDERWHLRRDGTRFWGSGLMMRFDHADGGFLKIFRDRTAEHEAEARVRALADLGEALRNLTNPADISCAAASVLGQTLDVSRVGYSAVDHDNETLHTDRDWTAQGVDSLAGELHLRDYGSFVDSLKRGEFTVIPDVREDGRTAVAAAALESKSTRSFVNAPVLEQGRLAAVFFVNCAVPRHWSDGDLALIKDFADRTRTAAERARGERELVISQERLHELNATLAQQVEARAAERDRLWNLSQDMLARADFTGMMSAVSPAWTQVLGWSEAELLSRGYATFMHPDDAPPTLEAIAFMARTQQPTRFENRIAAKGGGWKPIEWTVAPEPGGKNFIAVGRDLSLAKAREAELEIAREALRQSQKMEAMGSLTGGVAHDFNNLLTPILGSLDMLKRKGLGNEREQRLIDGALQSAERAKVLVQRLLAFARRQPLQATSVDIADLVRNMADLVASTTGPQIKVVVDTTADLPAALADANQFEMALLNLAVNARDAMPDGGVLRITATAEEAGIANKAGLRPGGYIRLSVADTGQGMDEETLKRAVEPFFSTKGIGKGTGLGLSMAHGLASQLGGTLTIQSQRNVGTNVELWLPISASPSQSPVDRAEGPAASADNATALLVDDEMLVRMTTADMLTDMGYDVVEADCAEQALDIVNQGLRPHLLVSDHLMPGMTGTELARSLRSRFPGIQILIVSGYAESEGVAPDLPRLTKPFRSDELAAMLASLAEPEM